jgi:hypothetical protein
MKSADFLSEDFEVLFAQFPDRHPGKLLDLLKCLCFHSENLLCSLPLSRGVNSWSHERSAGSNNQVLSPGFFALFLIRGRASGFCGKRPAFFVVQVTPGKDR